MVQSRQLNTRPEPARPDRGGGSGSGFMIQQARSGRVGFRLAICHKQKFLKFRLQNRNEMGNYLSSAKIYQKTLWAFFGRSALGNR